MEQNLLKGNLLVAQSGGPTAVINASLAGVITEALQYEDQIDEVYGAINGIEGILNEELIDLASESQQTIRLLKTTPGAALGSCRYKLKKQNDLEKILQVFEAHNIRFFLYIGGNDSQDSAYQIDEYAKSKGYELRVIGIPKTIDNDLPITDHCPGYGSIIKYIATTIKEFDCDCESLGRNNLVSIIEVMGRSTGWIAAGAALARRKTASNDAPHIILLPEVAFNKDAFLEKIKNILSTQKHCIIVAAEGLVDENGNFLGADTDTIDSFGHPTLGGVYNYLRNLVNDSFNGVKVRTAVLGHIQRTASHCASLTDINEAFSVGQEAVKGAINNISGKMVVISRELKDKYSVKFNFENLEDIANGIKKVPEKWISEDKMDVTNNFIKYAQPLIEGAPELIYEQGTIKCAKLNKIKISKKIDLENKY